jgi:hypothetical protein
MTIRAEKVHGIDYLLLSQAVGSCLPAHTTMACSHSSPLGPFPLEVVRKEHFQRLAFPPLFLSVTRNNHCMQKLAAILANNIAIMTHMLPKYTGRL